MIDMTKIQKKLFTNTPHCHVAIMKKEWGLIPKILSGKKKAESRWYKTRRTPWNRIKTGDIVYFKDTGDPVTVKAEVSKVIQYQVKDNQHALKIMQKHARDDLGLDKVPGEISDYVRDKKYAIFIFLKNSQEIKPFRIDKTGYGLQAAWLTVEDIADLKVPSV